MAVGVVVVPGIAIVVGVSVGMLAESDEERVAGITATGAG